MTRIFVFGSNLAGRHGKGAALEAVKNWGAKRGVYRGLYGRSYAIPTKDHTLKPRDLAWIRLDVKQFLEFAAQHPELQFLVTRIGCGLAGYTDEQIAPMFEGAPDNCEFDPAWRRWGLKTWLTLEDLIETTPPKPYEER